MSEITKLYENVGIEIPTIRLKIFKDDNGKIHTRPPFTAEKQIELIKWIAHRAPNGLLVNKHITDSGASMVFDNLGYESTLASSFISFEECLAKLVNNIWQDLTEEEKQQVRTLF